MSTSAAMAPGRLSGSTMSASSFPSTSSLSSMSSLSSASSASSISSVLMLSSVSWSDEKVGQQRGAGHRLVLREIGDAFGRENLVVDAEIAGELAAGAVQDRVGSVGHDLRGAAALHDGVAA